MLPSFPNINITSPATASSRVYVGNLHKDITLEELYDAFKIFGEIVGMKHNKNYAFIQYSNEDSAEEAIKNSLKIICHGEKIVVRPSVKGGKSKNQLPINNSNNDIPQVNSVGNRNIQESRDREMPKGNTRFEDPSPPNKGNWQYQNYYADDVNPQIYPPPPNDCEIIVVSKVLTEYAEFIEDKLKQIGLTVDVLYPNENVPIGRVLTNIASRGCLYAILVMPENYENRSLTLNILHGLSQEHRNMPLEDAIKFISRNFTELQESGGDNARPTILLHKLVSGKSLSVMEYDNLLKYITECREKQIKIELGGTATTQNLPITPSPVTESKDLQQRILSILNNTVKNDQTSAAVSINKPMEVSQPQVDLSQRIQRMLNQTPSTNAPQPVPAPTTNSTGSIHTDPSFQKALDSLKNKAF